jgi:serine protease Do
MKSKAFKITIAALCLALAAALSVSCANFNIQSIQNWINEQLEEPATDGGSTTAPGTANATPKPDTTNHGTAKQFKYGGKNGETYTVSEVYANSVDSVVGIRSESVSKNVFGQTSTTASLGTGIILTDDGYILTNNHVVESGTTFKVALYNGESYDATIVGTEKTNDVAVLKIEATGLKAATFGNSDELVVGEDVIVIGNPLGELTYTLTRGVVSALNRAINEDGTPISMFQIDAAVNEGNSGGPALDASGNVIGVVTAKVNSGIVEGIGFCIPINDALEIASQLIEYGYVKGRGALAIAATEAYRESFWGTTRVSGAYVNYVIEGGAADKAGIKKGMLITAVDNTEITSSDDLAAVLRAKSAGTTITVKGTDGKERFEVEVVLDEYTPDLIPEGWKTNDGIIL